MHGESSFLPSNTGSPKRRQRRPKFNLGITKAPERPQYVSKTKASLLCFFLLLLWCVFCSCRHGVLFGCCCLGVFCAAVALVCVFAAVALVHFLLLLPCCAACCRFLVLFFATVASVSFCCCCLYVLFAIVALVCVSFQFLPFFTFC